MAYYAALVSVLQSLEEMTGQGKGTAAATDKIRCIHEKMRLLQQLLNDYTPKDRQTADDLERRITEVAYKAQDAIESRISSTNHHHWLDQVKDEADSILDDAVKLTVKEEVESIVGYELRTKKSLVTVPPRMNQDSSDEHEASGESSMVGFDKQLMAIKEQLFEGTLKRRVVSVVGMGGIGKTTLARNIFEDKHIRSHFDCSAWVTVSQDYYFRKVLLSIVDSMNIVDGGLNAMQQRKFLRNQTIEDGDPLAPLVVKQDLSAATEEVLIQIVYKHLKGRRHLIVLDDMWDVRVWDDMMKVLPEDSKGNRVMITTRLWEVGFYAGTCGRFHQMEFLSQEQSWNLLCDKVFQQESCPTELEYIGKLIAKNCRGLPLAIVVVAGLLSKINRTQDDWEEMARNVSSAADQNHDHFSKILSLSYNHLPHHLKACFLYMGGFPEDYEIPISKLIKLWIAEGFVRPTEDKSLEQLGEEYLEDLVSRSLVLTLTTKKKTNGMFRFCSVHDLLRDLCIKRSRSDNFLTICNENAQLQSEAIKNARRLCVNVKSEGHIPPVVFSSFTEANQQCLSHVRSVVSFGWCRQEILLPLVLSFKLLTVLETVKTNFPSFPMEIVQLLHLRYLAFHKCTLAQPMLPVSISKFKNLQTLIIGSEIGFGNLPRCLTMPSIWQMSTLRHVIINEIKLPTTFLDPRITGEDCPILKNLHTLSKPVDLKFTDAIIEVIPNINKIKLLYLGYPHYQHRHRWRGFCLEKLVHLRRLQKLDIVFERSTMNKKEMVFIPLPPGFAFPSSLTKLALRGCRVPWMSLTAAAGALPNLQVLKLIDEAASGEVWEPVEGGFRQLKFLLLQRLDLKFWLGDGSHYPRLEHLEIVQCKELCEIPPEIGEIDSLRVIVVRQCKAADSAMAIQEEQSCLGNETLQVIVDRSNSEATASKEEEDSTMKE